MSETSLKPGDLPSTWALTSLGAVVDYGSTTKAEPSQISDEDWVLELEDIEKDSSRLLQRITFAQRQSKSTKSRFQVGDVLYGKLRPYLNKVLIADRPGYCTTEIVPIETGTQLDRRYLFYWLKHPAFLKYVEAKSHGMNMPRLGTDTAKAAPFVLAPRSEQTRIADQLDKLLARIQACNDRIDAIPALLRRLRQAVLVAATSGNLTEDVRTEMGWSSLWEAVPLKTLGELGRGKSKHRPRNDPRLSGGDYPFVQTGDVAQSGGLITNHRQTYSEFGLQQSRLWPAGTICITIAANIADTAILTYPACFPDSVVGFVADPGKCVAEFVKWSIDVIKDDLEAFAPATAQKNINLAVLNDIAIRCPSLEEQTEIVRRVEALFKLANRIEARYTAARTQAQRLTPLLLAKAFRGELVQQDPQDEPASVLLERIAATKPAKARTSRERPRIQKRPPAIPELDPIDWASLPDGAWAAPADLDGQAAMVWLTAVLRAWGEPMPERDARLAVMLCQQPRLFAAVLPAAQATQWSRLVGDEARPLPTQVLPFLPAINGHWARAIKGMRARDDLVEADIGDGITWALGSSAASIETAGWPDGRAGFVVAYLRAHGIASVLPLLEPSVQEFVDARAA